MGAYHRLEFKFGLVNLADLTALQAALGIYFEDISLLQQALVHRSFLNENPDINLPSNERLEFLGDAVLGYVVAEELYLRFPESPEGELTNFRSILVRGETLSRVALSLGLQGYLYLGKGEDESGGRGRARNLCCALEAVIAAVLMDQGFQEAKDFILRILHDEIEQLRGNQPKIDFKSRLQHIIQLERKVTPSYHTIEEEGPAHARMFTVEVLAGSEVLGRGSGYSKQAAEMEAARDAIESRQGG